MFYFKTTLLNPIILWGVCKHHWSITFRIDYNVDMAYFMNERVDAVGAPLLVKSKEGYCTNLAEASRTKQAGFQTAHKL